MILVTPLGVVWFFDRGRDPGVWRFVRGGTEPEPERMGGAPRFFRGWHDELRRTAARRLCARIRAEWSGAGRRIHPYRVAGSRRLPATRMIEPRDAARGDGGRR
ncbi:MAG: hypothetical protein WBV50_27055, partial [Candidatus Acidiferrum sp.]